MNFKTLILISLVCLCSFDSISAQNKASSPFNQSDLATWYKITNQEAEQIFKNERLLTDSTLLHTQISTISAKEYAPKDTEFTGYYLKVTANAENLDIQLKNFNSISAQILKFQQGFALRVVDSMGILIPTASVFYNDKKIPFNEETQTFQCQKCKPTGQLVLKGLGEAVFYDVEERYRYYRKKPFFQTTVGKIIKFPYGFVRKAWWRIKTFTFFEKKYRGKEYQGYIACNKPKYQPFDTLKVKAFIANRKGKPLKETLEARLLKGHRNKAIWKQTIAPNPAGNYEVEVVLGDTLQLDKDHQIAFYKIRKNEEAKLMSQFFGFEDYELDAIDFSFQSDKEKYRAGDSIQLHLSAKYKTGLYAPDAFVKLVARTKVLTESNKLDNFQVKETFVKDTIWTHSQALNSSDTSLIYLPLSAIPKANATIWVDAEFTDSSGEYQSKSVRFEVEQKDADAGCLRLRLEEEFVVAECIENGVSVPQKVSFDMMGDDSEIWAERIVELPYRERINGGVWDYSIYALKGEGYAELDMEADEQSPNIYANSYERNDSVYILLQNKRRIPIYYTIYTDKKILAKGNTEAKEFRWRQKKSGYENYLIRYSYLWGDEPHSKERAFNYSKNKLNINIEQAENVRPGETIQVKITAKDHNKKAASKVNLTAGAINGKFDNFNNYSGPFLQQKTAKEPKGFPNLKLNRFFSDKSSKSLNKKWYEQLQLKEKLYYQLRYPSNGVFMQSDSMEEIAPKDTFYRDIAQFSPHLVKNGKEQPIYLIYCNQRLVYYYEVNSQMPYSFVGEEGYNQIEIRGRNFSYTIDSLLLKKGHKLTFSIDENHYPKSKIAQHIRRQAVESELSQKECNLLAQQIFTLRIPYNESGEYYVLQDAQTIHPIEKEAYGRFQIGPFFPQNELTLIRRGHYHNTFLFEHGFEYTIAAQRERLYENTHFSKPFELPQNLPDKPIEERIFHPKNIQYQKESSLQLDFDSPEYQTQANHGLYEFEYDAPKKLKVNLMAVALMLQDSTYGIYENDIRKINNLPPNDYQLLLIQKNGDYLQKNFKIEANTLTFQRIDSTTNFVADSSLQFFNQVLQKRLSKKYTAPLTYKRSEAPKHITGNGRSGIKGIVRDEETGETLPFVNVAVSVKGFVIGTTTDFDGFYELDLKAGTYLLTYSYVGYQTRQIDGIIVRHTGKSVVNSELGTASELLDIVEVVEYKIPLSERHNRIRELESDRTVTAAMIESIPVRSVRGTATDYYIDGIKVKGNRALPNSALNQEPVQLRSNFSDYAYWQPTLLTDQNGEAYFNVTFPDNTTQWKTFVLGMNDKGQGGLSYAATNAYKDIMAELSLPRFLIEGDKTHIVGKSLNYTGDSINIQTSFKIGEELFQSNSTRIKEFLVEKAQITVPSIASQEKLSLTYSLQLQDGYSDGEQRQIPILKKGIEETVGEFYALEKDTTIQFSFNENLGEVHLYAQNNVFDLLQNDLDYLQNYPYGCNEQNASRLMAFLMDKEIKAQLGQPFRQEKALNKTIKKLLKTQNSNGTWGWWQGNSFNLWMTLYVHKALKKAKLAGYSAGSDEWTVRYLVNLLPQLKGRDLLKVLSHLNEINLNTDYEKHLQKADSTLANPQLYDRLKMLQIRQRMELPHNLQLLDSLRQQTTFGNYFWGKQGYGWHDNAIQNTLLAFDIYQRANRTADCQKIIGYFLERRGRKCWRNTFETAQILQAILPTLLEQSGGELTENQLVFSGAFDQTITEFPFEAKLSANKPLQIQKTGSTPLYFTAYQSFWNSEPQAKSDIFAVETTWQNTQNEEVQSLKAMEKAILVVGIEVKESAEYVMIEVPIPAGCSYGNKGEKTHLHEVHREYFKEKVAIFCRELPIGKHTFEVPLEARYTGDYTVNPTKVEQMYFPVFYGRNEVGEVEVK